VKIWIGQDVDTGDYWVLDESAHEVYRNGQYGPVDISSELFERIRECEREQRTIQDILDSLVYEWQYPDDDTEMDCD